jgi:glycosyltransferase involved in cell wall biosynthesis
MALVEWLYRALFKGVLFRPAEQVNVRPSSIKYPTTDQLLFIRLRWNKAWFVYVLIRYLLMGRVDNTCTVTNLRSLWKLRSAIQSKPIRHEGWKDHDLMQSAYPVSVIIPTVERYSYLFTVLKHLQKQTIKPREVIVIDQTPVKLRQEQFVQDFGDIGLIYLTLETLGQCTSRNMGLLKSTGDYILFIDDDVELKPDVIEKHLKCLEYFDADVSCGVCDEVGAGPVSPDFNLIRNSDVLPTNNGMVRRSALMKSGLFDRAFNQGQRADGELGARLYKSGARLILNPEIRVLHHRAPRGGLRKHQVRKVTYATSRKYITHFRLPHATEIYLNRLHFSKAEQQEAIVLSLLGCFSIRGGFIKRVAKVLFATFIFPVLLIRIYNRSKVAGNLLKQYPQVDFLLPDQ